jgi:hypothetical protein
MISCFTTRNYAAPPSFRFAAVAFAVGRASAELARAFAVTGFGDRRKLTKPTKRT